MHIHTVSPWICTRQPFGGGCEGTRTCGGSCLVIREEEEEEKFDILSFSYLRCVLQIN